MITWITGHSNSGKTTLAKQIHEHHKNTIILDGDQLRPFISDSTYERYVVNLAHISKILSEQGHDVIVSARVLNENKSRITSICNPEWIEL